jgi:hypothetical protein
MRQSKIVLPLLVLGLAMAVGCAKPPQAQIDAARNALQAARDAGAADYAAASLREAENALSALDAEVTAQTKKFALMRSFKQAGTLAASAQAAADKAAADAVTGKEKTRADAEALLGQARTAMDEANAMLATAPAGKGSQMEIEAMKADMQGVATAIAEGEQAHAAGRFLESKAKFEAALQSANNVKGMIEQAKAMRAGKKAS